MQQPSLQQAQQRLDDVTTTVDNLSLSNNITITAVDSKNLNNNNNNNINNNNNLHKVRCSSISENSIGEIASPGSVPEARSPSGANDGFGEIQSEVKDARTAYDKTDETESKERGFSPSSKCDPALKSLSAFRDGCTLFEKYSGNKGEDRISHKHPLSNHIRDDGRFSFNKDLVIKPIPSKLQMSLKDCKTEEIEVQNTNAFVLHSWHPHVYAKPPKTPTPHSILDILGTPHKKMCFSPPIVRGASSKEKEERLPPSNEEAEDENFASDEPLNLCVSKSRDVSPSSSIGSRTVTPPIKIPHGLVDPSRGIVNGRPELLASSPGKIIHHLKGEF